MEYQKSTYSASNYSGFRPNYPESLFQYLKQLIHPKLAIDVGCGTGIATKALAKISDQIIAIEPSQSMIDTAEKDNAAPNIEYTVGTSTDLEKVAELASVDAVFAATAAHYFSYPDFWSCAKQVLKPNGYVALWTYIDLHIVGVPEFNKALRQITYGDLGPYWDSGRKHLDSRYYSLMPKEGFKVVKHDKLEGDAENYNDHTLAIELHCTFADVLNRLRTYSPYHKWKQANPDLPDLFDELAEKCLSWNLEPSTRVVVRHDTVLLVLKAV